MESRDDQRRGGGNPAPATTCIILSRSGAGYLGSYDKSQKTEEPTQKRLDDARKKGQVASSREVNTWCMILAGTVLMMLAPLSMGDFTSLLARFLSRPHEIPIGSAHVMRLGADTVGEVLIVVAPLLSLLFVAALAGGLIQNGPLASVDKITPKLENLSLIKGLGRLFSLRSLMEFVKGILKMTIVGTVAFTMIAPEIDRIAAASAMQPTPILHLLWALALRMMGGVCAVIAVIPAFDFLYQKFEFMKSMRMSKQEIKDEMRQAEGDPMIKARLRQLRLERARKRMMAAVPEADVVIANPTHFAVALKYDTAVMDAPRLTAKGVDNIALRIREVAETHGVPVIENPPLARALHGGVEIDQEIPQAYYRAVAEVIGYVWRLKGRRHAATAR